MIQGEIKLVSLAEDYFFKPFDCGDNDLNDFLLNDSKNYQRFLIATTYIIESENRIAAFYSLLNDKISIADTPSKSA